MATERDVLPCSAKWQERNGALEEVSNILKGAGGHVQPSIGNLLTLLKVWTLHHSFQLKH